MAPYFKKAIGLIDPYAKLQLLLLGSQSAQYKIKISQRLLFIVAWLVFTVAGIIWVKTIGLFIFFAGMLNYFVLLFFRIKNAFPKSTNELLLIEPANMVWPTFSIIFPLKGEDEVIHETIKSIHALEYPKDLVQVIVVVEETDEITQHSLSQIQLPPYFQVLKIPTLPPYTKGRALLYALEQASGKYITVYDAESRPEPMQLKKAAITLLSNPNPICCQAKIRISNKSQNWLTRNFAVEYFEWYEKHLNKLSDKGLPFGLGGNSFFIDKQSLVDAYSWDPFNVTEDVDLSVRLVKHGVKLSILDSYTDENCPDNMNNWVKQRTRWNKGLFITQLVHLRKTFMHKNFSFNGWMGFWLRMVCGSLLPFYNIYIALYMFFARNTILHAVYFSIALWSLLLFNLLISLGINMNAYKKLGIKQSVLMNFFDIFRYLLLNIVAGFEAFWEYFAHPLKWNKTVHIETVSE